MPMPTQTRLAQPEFPPRNQLSDDRGNWQRTLKGVKHQPEQVGDT
jgi:hypothetical protein